MLNMTMTFITDIKENMVKRAASQMASEAKLHLREQVFQEAMIAWLRSHTKGVVASLEQEAFEKWLESIPASRIEVERRLFSSEVAWLEACAEYGSETELP